MEKRRRQRLHKILQRTIMQILFKEEALSLAEIGQNQTFLSVYFQIPPDVNQKNEENLSIDSVCSALIQQKLICLNKSGKYELTDYGKTQAQRNEKLVRKNVDLLKKEILRPEAAARNSIIGYGFLAVTQLIASIFSGSAALLADGMDNCVSTASSGIVWFGIRLKKELVGTIVIILLMLASAISLGVNSALSIARGLNSSFLSMSMPFLVIITELSALVFAVVFFSYQRLVGKRNKSLALISQSIDSRNNIFSSAAVIAGAVFSIFGVYWLDAIIGGVIALKIAYDGLNMTRNVINSSRGLEPDFNKFKLPFEERIRFRRIEGIRRWILYTILEEKVCTKQEVVDLFEKNKSVNLPSLLSEVVYGKEFDFEEKFEELIKPLIDEALLLRKEDSFVLTSKGNAYVQNYLPT